MEPAVILFFATVLIVAAMICWTAVSVTQKIVAYKTLSLEHAAAQTGQAALPAERQQDTRDGDLAQSEPALEETRP
ncbi:MAG: hypothetical protein AAF692_07180 [Pseudomonadota bacterium]